MRRRLGVALLVSLATTPLAAHDMWLVPSDFAPAAGELVSLGLRVGHAGSAEAVVRNSTRLVRFAALGPVEETPVPGLDGADPAGYLRPATPGLYAVAYESNAAYSELPPEKFAAYLAEEGLEAVLAARREHGETERPGRELYTRSLKTLLQVDPAGDPLDRRLGLPLEFLLESVSPAVTLRLELHGEPLAGALVEVRPIDGQEPLHTARTDAEGRLQLSLAPGPWLATTVHMQRAVSERAEWESVWASLSFRLSG